MAITWEELRGQVIDLGFEEDEVVAEDYPRVLRNSVNRAIDIVMNIVVPQIEGYYKVTKDWGYEDATTGEWVLPKAKHITEETLDTDRINLPDNLMPLVPLIAAHYLWLDDDITKAVTYWNEFDLIKDQIISVCRQPRKATIEGGW